MPIPSYDELVDTEKPKLPSYEDLITPSIRQAPAPSVAEQIGAAADPTPEIQKFIATGGAKKFQEFVERPLVKAPRIPEQRNPLLATGAGLLNTLFGAEEAVTTPENIALGAAAAVPEVRPVAGAAFATSAFRDIPIAVKEAFQPGTSFQRGVELGGRTLTDILFGVLGMKVGGEPAAVKTPVTDQAVAATQPERTTPSATQERQITQGREPEHPGDVERGLPAQAGGGRGVEPTASEQAPQVTPAAEPTDVTAQAAAVVSGAEPAAAAARLLPSEKQGDLISSTQAEPFALVGEKGVDVEARQAATESAAQRAEEARLKAESEQELLSGFQEHQAAGGDELLDAVQSGGGLPALSSTRHEFAGELQNIREEFTKPSGAIKYGASYNRVFKRDAPDLDALTQHLKGKGFNVETPADTLDLIQKRLRSGDPIYGAEARGAALGEAGTSYQKLGIVPQPSEFVKQDVAKAVGGVFKGARQIKSLLTPANVSELSGITSRVIRENAAELARKKEMAATQLREAAQLFRKNDKATNLDVIDRLETGKDLGSAGLNAYKDARKTAYDERIKQVQEVNPNALEHLIEDYFPHIWTRESVERVGGNLANIPPDNAWARIFGKRPLAGPGSFLKQRKLPTTAEGVAIGLEPVTTNPVALDLLKMHEMDRYVMGNKVMQELKDRGIAKFVRAGDKADFGYTQINDKIARISAPREWQIVDAEGRQMPGQKVLGNYYAPDDAARVINNYLSPGLRGFAPYDAFRLVGNLMNQVQLGISAYHATFTSIDAATSTLSLGLEQIARSGGSPKELTAAAGNIAKAFAEAPFGGAMIENLWRGNKFLREYSKPGTTNAELARIVDTAVAGGARVRMDTFYNTGAVASFFDALKSGNYGGAVLRAPFALVQTVAKPLMEYAVPRMKLGIISQNLEYELRKLPQNATRDDVRKIAARTVDSVDNRMGQLIYDNLFWNKALKDGLMASVRSVGWNLGDIRELGGGALDTVTAPKRAYDQLTKGSKIADNPIVTKRMTYMVALPLMVGALGSMYQYLMTGERPKDLMDVYMPRTGRMKPDGSPERVMLPTYMKDIAPLALAAGREGAVGFVRRGYSMAMNKLHPAITTVGQMLHNQDYYGNQIRNADDGLVDTVRKESLFVMKNFRPFSIQGVAQREGGLKEKAQAVIGLMPAPRELTDTPAMRLIHEINLSRRPAGGYSAKQQEKRAAKRAERQGQDVRPELFKRLSNEDKGRVMELATPEERDVFESYKSRDPTKLQF